MQQVGLLLVVVCGLRIAVASLIGEHGLWGTQASVVAPCGLSSCRSWSLGHRLNTCGTWDFLLCGMWDISQLGIEPMSSALAGRLFTTTTRETLKLIFNWSRRYWAGLSSVQFSSVHLLSHVQLFGDPMNCSMPGLPVHHQLPKFTQTHVH